MFDPTKPVQTRDGRKATILVTDLMGPYPIAARVAISDKQEEVCTYHDNGQRLTWSENLIDLVNIKVKKEAWINIYSDEGAHVIRHPDEEFAKHIGKSSKDYITTIRIEWEE